MAMKIRWTVGDRFLDIVTNEIATIIALPDKRRVFAEWMDGSRDWVSRDDLREIWATSFAE
jgi:hypothetical protein